MLLLAGVPSRVLADYYVAPSAAGTGDGSSATNAAYYLNSTFWTSTVQTALNSAAVTVWFANGTYTAGLLELQNQGNPLHTCTLAATTSGSVTLQADSAQEIIWLRGSQNFTLSGFVFTGLASQCALNLSYYPNPTKTPTRMITVSHCIFQNLTNLSLGAILFGANRDVTVDSCTFTTVTGPTPAQVHGCYVGNSSQNVAITNCTFTDLGGESVRFRDDSEYGLVSGCSFHSTADGYNQPFISVPLFNSQSPSANEFFGSNFQFTGNTFRYDTTGGGNRYAHYFYNDGYDVPAGDALEYFPTTAQASTLTSGTQAQQDAILSPQMELSRSSVKIYSETYHGVVWATVYRAYPNYGSTAPAGSYTSDINISTWPGASGSLATAPIIRNGQFEELGNRLRKWYLFAGTAPADHPGLNGTVKAIKLASSSATQFGQWLRGPLSDTATLHCLFAVGAHSGSGILFQMQLYHNEVTNSYLAFAVNSSGALGYVNSSGSFVAVPALGTIAFSVDANGNGSYSDPGDTLNWYQLRITADYSGATPTFTISRGVANTASDYTYSSGPISAWVGNAPTTGSTIGLLNFTNANADVIVDECW